MEPTDHIILKSNGEILVKCGECSTVHVIVRPLEKIKHLRVIVSIGGKSRRLTVEADPVEELVVGEEFVADDEQTGDVIPVEITSLELSSGGRVERARAGDVETVWARGIGKVAVKVSVHRGARTESITFVVPGDREFRVGDRIDLPSIGRGFRITKIKEREGRLKERPGTMALAKDVRRIYAREPRWK